MHPQVWAGFAEDTSSHWPQQALKGAAGWGPGAGFTPGLSNCWGASTPTANAALTAESRRALQIPSPGASSQMRHRQGVPSPRSRPGRLCKLVSPATPSCTLVLLGQWLVVRPSRKSISKSRRPNHRRRAALSLCGPERQQACAQLIGAEGRRGPKPRCCSMPSSLRPGAPVNRRRDFKSRRFGRGRELVGARRHGWCDHRSCRLRLGGVWLGRR